MMMMGQIFLLMAEVRRIDQKLLAGEPLTDEEQETVDFWKKSVAASKAKMGFIGPAIKG